MRDVRTLFLCALLAVLAAFSATPAHAEGGETIESATVITYLPFWDTGNTCGHVNDYDEACPWAGSTAPDVVYAYTPPYDDQVGISLCNSSYDTKLYVYAGGADNLLDCNDDGCADAEGQSNLFVPLAAGTTYYVVIDGYGVACGTYRLEIEGLPPCQVACPAGAVPEGEPPCPNLPDDFNGGCDGSGWTRVDDQGGGCGVVHGITCRYEPGLPRDEDWYALTAVGGPITAAVDAEFPVTLSLFHGIDCQSPEFVSADGWYCESVTLAGSFPAGQEFWLLVAPTVGTFTLGGDYCLEACGVWSEPPVPAVVETWGRIKGRYR